MCVLLHQSIQSADARQKALNEELEKTRELLTQEIESLRLSIEHQVHYMSVSVRRGLEVT